IDGGHGRAAGCLLPGVWFQVGWILPPPFLEGHRGGFRRTVSPLTEPFSCCIFPGSGSPATCSTVQGGRYAGALGNPPPPPFAKGGGWPAAGGLVAGMGVSGGGVGPPPFRKGGRRGEGGGEVWGTGRGRC